MIFVDITVGIVSGSLIFMFSRRLRGGARSHRSIWRRVPNDFNALSHVCVCGHRAHQHGSSCNVRLSPTPFGFCTCSQSGRWVRKYGKDPDLLRAMQELS